MVRSEVGEKPEVLVDIKVAEAPRLYRLYLVHEAKILGLMAVAGFLLVWEIVGSKVLDPFFISAPSLVTVAGFRAFFVTGEIWPHLWISGTEFFWGFLLSALVGVPLGVALGWYKKLANICDPFVNALNATPRVAFLPLIVIWLGIDLAAKVALIFAGAVLPILINTRDGVKTTPPNLLNAGRSFGASQWQIFKTIVVPSTVPFILTGLRLGVGRALIYVLVAEMYAGTAGVGYMITEAGSTFQTDKVFVGVLIFAAAGMVCMGALNTIERRLSKWRPKVGAA